MDLNNLRERTLLQCSYSEAVEIVEAIEKIKVLHASGIDAIEELETCLSFVLILKGRLSNDEFSEIKGNDKRRERNNFSSRLNLLYDKISFALEVNIRFNKQNSQVYSWISDVQNQVNNEKEEIQNTADSVRDEIANSEHTILSHVLSLMGIFSAIITLIMSVVISSASWLNSANRASAIMALIVPNLVALIAVLTLMSLIFFYIHRDTKAADGKCAQRKRSTAFSICVSALILCVIASCVFCFAEKDEIIEPHIIYIFSPGEYLVKEEIITPASADGSIPAEEQIFYEFTYEDKLYRFEYDESLKHSGNLYFCEKHCTLE